MKKLFLFVPAALALSSLSLPSCTRQSPGAVSVPGTTPLNLRDYTGSNSVDVVVVTNELASIPLFGTHTAGVKSLISGKTWNHTFPHEGLNGHYYVVHFNGTYTRVTRETATRVAAHINNNISWSYTY